MRIIAGMMRGKALVAPAGLVTRPTAQRMRQALFDILAHAPWGGATLLEGAAVLDVFAGSGALGLEALSRGAGRAIFMERDPAALMALRTNIAACRSEERTHVIAGDALSPPPGSPQTLIFMDPPYELGLLEQTVPALRAAGWIARTTVLISETARHAPVAPDADCLAQRVHGAARITIWREAWS